MRGSTVWMGIAVTLSVTLVPFRHRTLVTDAEGHYDFREERVWAPLWNQPSVHSGVAEYPFGLLLSEWAILAAAGGLVFLRRRRSR